MPTPTPVLLTPSSGASTAEEGRLGRLAVAAVAGFFLVDGILRTGYFHFGARATGSGRLLTDTVVSEMTGSVATFLVVFAVIVPVCRRWPLRGRGWVRRIPVHLAGLLAFSVLKTLLMWGMRVVLFPLFGLGGYDYGDMLYRVPMELSNDVLGYVTLAFAVHVWYALGEFRERQLREARLEARLGEARLQALQGQLQPHFLFNTLHTISSVMYQDPERADRLLSRLSDLLRSSLAAPGRPEVPVEEEVQALGQYVEIMRARFEDRLTVDVRVDEDAREGRVPVFVLQPLVENAIQHGVATRPGPGRVEVRVERTPGRLRLTVEDDGPGVRGDPMDAIGRGVGLTNTVERLAHLYGDRGRLGLENRPSGGLRVVVEIPWRADGGATEGGESRGAGVPEPASTGRLGVDG